MFSIFNNVHKAKKATQEHNKAQAQAAENAADIEKTARSTGTSPHTALDSMTLSQAHRDAGMHHRIRNESRKGRALSPRRPGLGKLAERQGSSSDLSITSVMDGASLDGDGLHPPLQPPPGENAYRHSTFEALANMRLRFGGGVNSPRDRGKGRIPLSMTPASSITGTG